MTNVEQNNKMVDKHDRSSRRKIIEDTWNSQKYRIGHVKTHKYKHNTKQREKTANTYQFFFNIILAIHSRNFLRQLPQLVVQYVPLTKLFSFTSSPSPYYHIVVVVVVAVVVVWGSSIIVVSIIWILSINTRTIIVDTSISIRISIAAVSDASNSTICTSIVVSGRRRR